MKPVPNFEFDPSLTDKQKRRRREYYADREENIRKSVEWCKNNRLRYRITAAKSRDRRRQKLREAGRIYANKHRELNAGYYAEYRTTEAFKVSMRKHVLKKKTEVILAYGGHCACCGEERMEFLSLDHIHNDGGHRRKSGEHKSGSGLYRQLQKQGFPKGIFQVLCHNCNASKGYYGYCPHEVETKELLGIPVDIVRVQRSKAAA